MGDRTDLIRSGLELYFTEVDGNNFLGLGKLGVALDWRWRTCTSALESFSHIRTLSGKTDLTWN